MRRLEEEILLLDASFDNTSVAVFSVRLRRDVGGGGDLAIVRFADD